MGNMSYCRFENTLGDLKDCLDAIREEPDLSETEARAKKELIKVCIEIVEASGCVVANDDDLDDGVL